MDIAISVLFLGLLIFFSHLFNAFFDKTKIPNVFLLLLIGIAVGPVAGLVTPEDFGGVGGIFTTITLIVILFESGTNLKFSEIKKSIGSAFLLTIVNFILSLGVSTVAVFYLTSLKELGTDGWLAAGFFGAIIGGTSSAVVIPIVKQLGLREKGKAILVLESALSDVLCLIVGLALLESMKFQQLEISPLLNKMWQAFLFALIIGIAAGFVWALVLQISERLKDSMFSTLAFAFIVYGLVETMGLNGGIATLAYGIMLGNSSTIFNKGIIKKWFSFENVGLEENEKNFYSEIVFILQTYFFVYIGISIKLGNPGAYALALLLVVMIIALRPISMYFIRKRDIIRKDKIIMSIMSPKGLVPAVLASIPAFMGLKGGEVIQDLGYAVVFVSILICSLLVIILDNDPLFFLKVFKKKKEKPEPKGNQFKDNSMDGVEISRLDDED